MNEISIVSEEEKQKFLAAHAGQYFWCDKEHAHISRKQCLINQAISRLRLDYGYHGLKIAHRACDRAGCWVCPKANLMQDPGSMTQEEKDD